MTEQFPYNSPGDWPRSTRLRARADGEFPDDPPVSDESADQAGDQARIAFEQGLRESVNRVMGADAAPDGLRERLLTAMRAEADASAASVTVAGAGDEGVLRPAMGDTRDRSFWARSAPQWLAAAAAIALAVTLVVAGINRVTGPAPDSPFTIREAAAVSSYVTRAHESCSDFGAYYERKFSLRTIDEAVEHVDDYLSFVPEDLRGKLERLEDAGFTFAGLGPCAIPGEGRSVHLIYRPANESRSTLSLFIQETGERVEGMCQEHCFTADCDTSDGRLVVWKCDGALHYLYAKDAASLEAARTAMKAPARDAKLVRGDR